jgi:hypothetical protein
MNHEIEKHDDALFAQLIKPSQERVCRLALRIMRNTEDAEDVQQETMLKAHRKLGQFEGRCGSARNKRLMKLIERSIPCRDGKDDESPMKHPSLMFSAHCAQQQKTKNEVFRKVCGLPNQKVEPLVHC